MSDSATLLPTDSPACCLGCHYPLRELTVNRCPECGREFDPNDAKTMYLRGTPGPLARFLILPPGWPMHSVAFLALVLILIPATSPIAYDYDSPMEDFLDCFVPCAVVIWLLRLLCSCVLAFLVRDPIFKRLRTWRRWLTLPALTLLVWLLLNHHVPFHAAFLYSRPAMEQVAQEVMQMPVGTKNIPDHRIGLYPGNRIERVERGMRFRADGGRFGAGFAYFPGGPPPRKGDEDYVHIDGPWYLFLVRCSG